MAKNKFIMLNLEEQPAKELAEVLASEKSRAILNYLADKDHATASQISKALEIPLSTLNYQLKKVVASGLVENDEYHYSKKGKNIEHYKLAQKHIIISPKKVKGLKTKLANLLPLAVLGVGAVIIQLQQMFTSSSAQFAVSEAAVMEDTAASAAPKVAEIAQPVATSEPNIALWFILGGVLTFTVYYLVIRRNI